MSLVRYFVFNTGREWLITLDGDLLSRHPSRSAAVKSAAVMADLMGAMHHEADAFDPKGTCHKQICSITSLARAACGLPPIA